MNIYQYETYQEKKQHGEIDFPYTTYVCTIPQDFDQVPLHWHEEMEFIYIKKGQGRVAVNLTEFQVDEGSIILVLPGQLHSIDTRDPAVRLEYENIIFNSKKLLLSQDDICSQKYLIPLFSGKTPVPVHFSPDMEYYQEVAEILNRCDTIRSRKIYGEEMLIKSQLYLLFYVLTTRFRLSEPVLKNRKSLERMKTVIKHVELHYGEQITIEEVAQLVSLSTSHFMKCFRETFGCSFVEYLKEYRLTMAARMLMHSDGNVLEISELVGFNNLSYFIRSFKVRYGVTPGKYSVKQ
ncbi:MAG: AraC family transcriptional regulator [Lachnospiraceae bacterium]|nr:AraC family transcriptional regulator [Lachnospiraceae bacterium]